MVNRRENRECVNGAFKFNELINIGAGILIFVMYEGKMMGLTIIPSSKSGTVDLYYRSPKLINFKSKSK